MLGDFWKGLGGKLAERWLTALFSPACLFWFAGALAWLHGPGRATVRDKGWAGAAAVWTAGLTGRPALVQCLAVVASLLLLTLSGLLLQFLSRLAVRLLEGYGTSRGLARLTRERLSRRAQRDIGRLRLLAARPAADLDADELAVRGRLVRAMRSAPLDPARRMPTRLGNLLRASEDRVRAHYGLDPVICWPRLWFLLPDTARNEIVAARRSLYLSVQVWVCAVASAVWSVWSLWAIPLSLVVAATAYRGFLLSAAGQYAELVESCFDLYRRELYTSLRWPLPADPLAEHLAGQRLTTYLTAGSRRADPAFAPPESG
ncbi:hypothetical protein [Streptomyces sp. NPDC054834]